MACGYIDTGAARLTIIPATELAQRIRAFDLRRSRVSIPSFSDLAKEASLSASASSTARTSRIAHSTSAVPYLTAAAAASATLFFVLWWMLQAEETPWVPAGLVASSVMLVAAFARLLVARRARVAFARNQSNSERYRHRSQNSSSNVMRSTSLHAAALRALQKQSAEADSKDTPEVHRELYEVCCEYLAGAEKALLFPGLQPDGRVALRAGQDRVRELQKHHLLTWARGSARALTHEAQRRVRLYEKIEAANRALECIDTALKLCPDEDELNVSAHAIRDFITSSRVAHWVELAERAAFKGYHRRAIDCYKDALFYLTRDRPGAAGEAAAERITREIDMLRARMDTADDVPKPSQATGNKNRSTRRSSRKL